MLESGLQDLKIIEEVIINEDIDVDAMVENEDTLSLLKKYIDESEMELNKNRIKELINSIYQEAFQLG